MLGARLARRIVLPLLVAVALLFALLGVVAVGIANRRVERELEEKATRIAGTLGSIPQLHVGILEALAELMGVGLVIDPYAVGPGLDGVRAADLQPTLTLGDPWEQAVGGRTYVVIERAVPRHGRCLVLTERERVAERQRDVLMPIAAAGAIGLAVALLLGVLVARAIARPVKGLADSVRGFGEGR
jgi:hypothetical protein